MFRDDTNLLYLMFLKPMLHEVTQVNIIFQGTNVDVSKAHGELKKLLFSLIKRILKPNHLNKIIQSKSKVLHQIEIETLQNAIRFPGAHLPNNSVDYGWQFEKQSKASTYRK